MYIIPSEVRSRSKLLTDSDIPDTQIKPFITDAESYINRWLGALYVVPVQKQTNHYLTGTVSTNAASPTITGVNTEFWDQVGIDNFAHIRVIDSGEVFLVSSIGSDTSITAVNNAVRSVTGSKCFIIPEDICTAVRYLAQKLIIDWKFSEQAFNQETDKYVKRPESFAMSILEKIKRGEFYDSSLVEQISASTPSRSIGILSTTTQDNNNNNIAEINSWWD